MPAADLLRDAAKAIDDRAALRDQPGGERSMSRTVAAFNTLTGHSLSELDGWRFMCVLKMARAAGGAFHLDDWTDLSGYGALAGECGEAIAAQPPILVEKGAVVICASGMLEDVGKLCCKYPNPSTPPNVRCLNCGTHY